MLSGTNTNVFIDAFRHLRGEKDYRSEQCLILIYIVH
jgi:hypothetical protein